MRKLEIAIAGLSGIGLVVAVIIGTTQQFVPRPGGQATTSMPFGALGVMQVPYEGSVAKSDQAEWLEQIAPAAGTPR